MNKYVLIFVVVSLTVMGGLLKSTLMDKEPRVTKVGSVQDEPTSIQALSPLKAKSELNAHQVTERTNKTENFEQELVQTLISSYSDKIHLLHIQASLMKVQEFVLQRYPLDGATRFSRIIHSAFPEYAAAIMALLDQMSVYNEWIADNQTFLLEHSFQEQQGLVWEKRRDLFGEDAEKIWAEELAEMSSKQSEMHTVINMLDQAEEMSMHERIYQLKTAISEHYDGGSENLLLSSATTSKAFLSLASVQKELGILEPDERQQVINDIRRELGLSEANIKKLEEQDEVRNQRWEAGLAYMQEREALIASVDVSRQQAALDELRHEYFDHEAITIKREEESDFWRFKRRRIYGSN